MMVLKWFLRYHIKTDNWHPEGVWFVFTQLFFHFLCVIMPVFTIQRKSDQDKTGIQNLFLEDHIHPCLNCVFLLQISLHINWASNSISIILWLILESNLFLVWVHMDTNRINRNVCMYLKSEFDLSISMLRSGSLCSVLMKNISIVFYWNVP